MTRNRRYFIVLAVLLLMLALVVSSVDAGHKVTICHTPPGNPANSHTISVDDSAVPAHMAHGDSTGACAAAPTKEAEPTEKPAPTAQATEKPAPTVEPTDKPQPTAQATDKPAPTAQATAKPKDNPTATAQPVTSSTAKPKDKPAKAAPTSAVQELIPMPWATTESCPQVAQPQACGCTQTINLNVRLDIYVH